jgi:REP element-mobilizing transposase RayT
MEKCEKYLPEVATLYAFALIPNHFHFLIKVHSAEAIGHQSIKECSIRVSQVFSNLFNSYTKSFNRYYLRRGTLFSRHFKSKAIDTICYRTNCLLYIHHNGVHHQLCKKYDEWPYTSHARILEEPDRPETIEVLSWFGGVDNYLHACERYAFNADDAIDIE